MNWTAHSDKGLLETIGKFIQHHRLNQNKTQGQLATEAGMSRSTLSLLERGEKVNLLTLIQALRTLDLLYIMDNFEIINQISPIALAKLQKKKRFRASPPSNNMAAEPDPEW